MSIPGRKNQHEQGHGGKNHTVFGKNPVGAGDTFGNIRPRCGQDEVDHHGPSTTHRLRQSSEVAEEVKWQRQVRNDHPCITDK